MTGTDAHAQERADLLESLRRHRHFLRYTVRDLTDAQATACPTRSSLCLGGLIKHVTVAEDNWLRFAVGGAANQQGGDPSAWEANFRLLPGETLADVLAGYDRVAATTDELVGTLDLDKAHRLPPEPWFEQDASWTVRRVLLHVIAETSQHAGHADILRESIDGAKTMG
jgi:uncharacterized damage-inducible protein DinB